jgi:hypothetical protein
MDDSIKNFNYRGAPFKPQKYVDSIIKYIHITVQSNEGIDDVEKKDLYEEELKKNFVRLDRRNYISLIRGLKEKFEPLDVDELEQMYYAKNTPLNVLIERIHEKVPKEGTDIEKQVIYEKEVESLLSLDVKEYRTLITGLKERFEPLDLDKLWQIYYKRHPKLKRGGTIRRKNNPSKLRKLRNASRKRKTNKKNISRR